MGTFDSTQNLLDFLIFDYSSLSIRLLVAYKIPCLLIGYLLSTYVTLQISISTIQEFPALSSSYATVKYFLADTSKCIIVNTASVLYTFVLYHLLGLKHLLIEKKFLKRRNCNGYVHGSWIIVMYFVWFVNIYMNCILWTPFQAQKDWTNKYRGIGLFSVYSNLCSMPLYLY